MTPIFKTFSALSSVIPSMSVSVEEASRRTLGANRNFWFALLIVSTVLVFIGVILEEAEGWMPYLNRVIPLQPITVYRSIKRFARLGWILIVLGVMGEGIFEIAVSRADAKLQQYDEAQTTDAVERIGLLRAELNHFKAQRTLLNTNELLGKLGEFEGTEYTFVSVYQDSESLRFLRELDTDLRNAGWKRVVSRRNITDIHPNEDSPDFVVPVGIDDGIHVWVEVPEFSVARDQKAAMALLRAILSHLDPPQQNPVWNKVLTKRGSRSPVCIAIGRKP